MANQTSTKGRLNLVLISAALLLSQQLTGAFTASGFRRPARVTGRYIGSSGATDTKLNAFRGRNGTESFWSPTEDESSRLKVRRRFRSMFSRRSSKSSRLEATNGDDWSGPATKSSSKFGVRNRVKAVLKKAKSRTGVNNASEEPDAPFVIAEVASIGGFVEDSDLVIKRKNGVATKRNGANATVNGSAGTTNGATALKPAVPKVDDLVVKGTYTESRTRRSELDVFRTDVPTPLADPLPFKLPNLSAEQKKVLLSGERVQEQSKMGREGSGYVVMDVKAPPYIIWEALLDFEDYPGLIKTVRSMQMFTSNKLKSGFHEEKPVPPSASKALRHYGIPSVTRAAFVLSKFKLNIGAIHNYRPHPDGHYMIFNLDPDCTNAVLKSAQGIWHTQANPDGKGEEYTRVWLLCELSVSRILPQFIVDYTAKRAMPRATNWLKPHVEPQAEEWRRAQERQQQQQ